MYASMYAHIHMYKCIEHNCIDADTHHLHRHTFDLRMHVHKYLDIKIHIRLHDV